MKISNFFILIILNLSVFGQTTKPAVYTPPLTRILFIFDASQSMFGDWETGNKITVAKKMLNAMVDSLSKVNNVELALRVYGHQSPIPPQDCNDTKLEIPFSPNNHKSIIHKLNNIQPKGTTPIANSLLKSAEDFPECENCRNIIILITDGIEACDGDPCAVSLELQKKGIILKPFVLGIGLDVNFKKSFECIGTYYDASSESQFNNVLNIVISHAIHSTTAQVNLLDAYGRPNETNVAMSFIDKISGKVKHNYMHTINHRGNPDTLYLDPLSNMKMIVHTIPPVIVDSINISIGTHSIIAADTPQGLLEFKFGSGNYTFKEKDCIVRKKGEMQTLNVQQLIKTEKYLTGLYDIEILTLPRLKISNVEIKQSHTTSINIPSAGVVSFSTNAPGYGSVYIENESKKLEFVCNLLDYATKETLLLLPGNYRVVFRPKNVKETLMTKERNFKISSGASVSINLN